MVFGTPANAQVTPDGTLSTTVSRTGSNFTINNGNQVGNNLFHSFSQFSVPTNGAAIFNNAADVQTIFSRVTGGSVSNIDGLIQTNGNANLFLLNSAGILFGPNASLNVGGSFIASTADSVVFEDGAQFSTTDVAAAPLLTVNVPVGLQMGSDPGSIIVQGPGNQLLDLTGFGTPSTLNTPAGLQVEANRTLALIGGAVNFSGGVISTNGGGHLEIGSVSNGSVRLTATPTGWVGDYSAVSQFSDVHLAQDSILNTSGSNSSIQIQGQNVSLTEGSTALIQNFGPQSTGGITVNARGSLDLAGNTTNGQLGSLIQINNFGTGQTEDITISAAQLSLRDGARVRTNSVQSAGGNITANVTGTTEISGINRNNPAIYTALVTFSLGSGNAGDINVSTGNLNLLDSGQITSVALSSGNSGTIQVNATEQIDIAGYNPLAFYESSVSTFTQGSGNANNAIINTSRLVIQDGGSLGSSTVASGSAGSVEINASEFIHIQGRATQGNGAGTISRIFSNAELLSPAAQAAFGLPAIPAGNAGFITINTPSLRIADGGAVSVKNDGPGLAGNVQINAESMFLERQSSITAVAQSGEGGNLVFDLSEILYLTDLSQLNAEAGGTGNGGNITINVPFIVGLNNSDIIANAVEGNGGKIDITAQGIFGLEFRDELTPESDITASSEFGVSGTVQINSIDTDPSSGVIELPENVADPSQQIATGCEETQGSQFIATGRGGVPQNPAQQVNRDRTWEDVRDLSAYRQSSSPEPPAPATVSNLIETTSWRRNANGQVELVAEQSAMPQSAFATCSGSTMNGRFPSHSTVTETATMTSQSVSNWEE
ncbi:MAG: two-partner secretion domain-containing protein [Thainema sp.]